MLEYYLCCFCVSALQSLKANTPHHVWRSDTERGLCLGHHPAACCSPTTNTHTRTLHIHTFVLSGRCTLYSRGSTEGEIENYLEHYLQTFVLYDFSPFWHHFYVAQLILESDEFWLHCQPCIVRGQAPIICSQTAIRRMEQFLIFQKFLV